jgi:hypothetical protein
MELILMSEKDFGLIEVCCIAESDGKSIRDTLERLRKSYTEESGLIHMKDFARAAFEFPWINSQCKIYAMMIVVQAIEYQQYRNELEEKVKQAVKDGIQMGASHERLAQSQNEQQAVEKAREQWEKEDGSAVKDFVALQAQIEEREKKAVEKAENNAFAKCRLICERKEKEAVEKAMDALANGLAIRNYEFSHQGSESDWADFSKLPEKVKAAYLDEATRIIKRARWPKAQKKQ